MRYSYINRAQNSYILTLLDFIRAKYSLFNPFVLITSGVSLSFQLYLKRRTNITRKLYPSVLIPLYTKCTCSHNMEYNESQQYLEFYF